METKVNVGRKDREVWGDLGSKGVYKWAIQIRTRGVLTSELGGAQKCALLPRQIKATG